MHQRNRGYRIWLGVALVALAGSARYAVAQNAPKLRYGFQTGREYPYDVKITAELGDMAETREGVLTYSILSTTDQQIVFKQTGRLATHSTPRPGAVSGPPRRGGPRGGRPSFPIGPRGFGGPRFGSSGPEGITIDRQGKRILSRELTHLPFLLGDQEMLMIEDLPTDGRPNWVVQGGAVVEEKAAGGPPFGGPFRPEVTTSERGASERSEYRLLSRAPDAYRITKNYHLQTGPEAGVKARFNMNGSGELQFDAKEGLFKSASMKYTIVVSADNITLTVPVTVAYRLLSSEEFAQYKQQQEEAQAKAAAALAKANAMVPFEPGERAKLLRDLRSKDPQVQIAAANRLAKVPADSQPGEIAKALSLLLSHGSNDWVKGAAVKALVIWAAPEAEATLIQASQGENIFIRGPAILALGKIPTEAAAVAVAAQMHRNRGEVGKALREMGPVAEMATIALLKEHDHWVLSETCAVLGEIGGEESLKALKAYAEHASRLEVRDATAAISAIEIRLASGGSGSTQPKVAKPAATSGRAPAEPEFRIWRDATGTYEVEASFVACEDQKVTLKKKDGKTVQVPLDKLSKEDRAYLEKLTKPANPFE